MRKLFSPINERPIQGHILPYMLPSDIGNPTGFIHGMDVLLIYENALNAVKREPKNNKLNNKTTSDGQTINFEKPEDCFLIAEEINKRKNNPKLTEYYSITKQISELNKNATPQNASKIRELTIVQDQLAKELALVITFGKINVHIGLPDIVLSTDVGLKHGDSYQTLARKLTNLGKEPPVKYSDNKLNYYDHLIAMDILSIMQGKEPEFYPKNKQFLCETVALIFCVEPARQEAAFGTSLFFLELIANQRSYGSKTKKPFLWRNVFDSAKLTNSLSNPPLWETKVSDSGLNFYNFLGIKGPFGPSTHYQLQKFPPNTYGRSKLIGGKAPISTSAQLEIDAYNKQNSLAVISNQGIYSSRSLLLKEIAKKDRNSQQIEQAIAHHRVVLKEIALLIHWLVQEHPEVCNILKNQSSPVSNAQQFIKDKIYEIFRDKILNFYRLGSQIDLTNNVDVQQPISYETILNIITTNGISSLTNLMPNESRAALVLLSIAANYSHDLFSQAILMISEKYNKIPCNEPDEMGNTILNHLICKHAKFDDIQLFIKLYSPNLLQYNEFGQCSLHLSILNSDAKMLQLLIQYLPYHESNIFDYKDLFDNNNLFHMAVSSNNIEILSSLLSICKNSNAYLNEANMEFMTPLLLATKNDCDNDIIKLLINAGADINFINASGNSVVHYIIMHPNKSEYLQHFIEKNLSLDKENNEGNFPIHIAAKFNNVQGIVIACKRNALDIHINHPNKQGETPLMLALNNKTDQDCITALLNFGANILQRNAQGLTPLHLAIRDVPDNSILKTLAGRINPEHLPLNDLLLLSVQFKREESFQFLWQLLPTNIDINSESYKHFVYDLALNAIAENNATTLNFLLKNHAWLRNTADTQGNSLLMQAIIKAAAVETIDCLINNYVSINQANNDGNSAMHLAAQNCRDKAIIESLMDAGANVEALNNAGHSPLALAQVAENHVYEESLKSFQALFHQLPSELEIEKQTTATEPPSLPQTAQNKKPRLDNNENETLNSTQTVKEVTTSSQYSYDDFMMLINGYKINKNNYCVLKADDNNFKNLFNKAFINFSEKCHQQAMDTSKQLGTDWLFIPVLGNDKNWSLLVMQYPFKIGDPIKMHYLSPTGSEMSPELQRCIHGLYALKNIPIQKHPIGSNLPDVRIIEIICQTMQLNDINKAFIKTSVDLQKPQNQQIRFLRNQKEQALGYTSTPEIHPGK